MSVLIGELLAASIAQENGTNQDTGGRHARSFGLATEAFRAIGVNIYRGGVHTAFTDLAGKVLKLQQKAIHPGDIDLAHVQQLIEETLKDPECDRPVLGIGVGTPGPIDLYHGSVLNPPDFPGMWGVALGSALAQTSNLPVRIDDDARVGSPAISFAYQWVPV